MKINNKLVSVSRFSSFETAKRKAQIRAGVNFVHLGDNNEFWVASGRSSSRLLKAGYPRA